MALELASTRVCLLFSNENAKSEEVAGGDLSDLSRTAEEIVVGTFRITPFFILIFLSAAIALAYLIHKMENESLQISGSSSVRAVPSESDARVPANFQEEIQEIPQEWNEYKNR